VPTAAARAGVLCVGFFVKDSALDGEAVLRPEALGVDEGALPWAEDVVLKGRDGDGFAGHGCVPEM